MKLTAENRKALEEALQPIPQQRNVSDEIIITDAAALLLEIWEPLAEMVEARGKATEGNFKYIGKDCNCATCCCPYEIYTEDYGKITAETRENAQFVVTTANNLALIRKAVG